MTTTTATATVPLIEAHNLSAGYGGVPVIRGLDLHVSTGEVVGLFGANGAGKSTTIMTLAGELRASGGEVRWQGQSTRASLVARARAGLGLVPEGRSVFTKLSVAENLSLGQGSVEAALELFPELEPHLRRHAGLLSGGQQQMLTLARALAARPKALLIDELSLGLAPALTHRLLEAVTAAARGGMAVLIVEQHVRQTLAYADRAYVLRRGQIALHGTAADLVSRHDEIEKLYLSAPGEASSL